MLHEFDFISFLQGDFKYSENLLDTLIHLTQNSYAFIEDLNTNVTWWSDAARQLLGISDRYEQDAFHKALSRIHPDDQETFLEEYSFHKLGMHLDSDILYRVKNTDGIYHFYSAKTTILSDNLGQPLYFVGLLKDNNVYPKIDALTNLYTQNMYIDAVESHIANHEKFAILKIGIDKFANLNMAYGVPFGDRVLREIALHFLRYTDANCKVYRLEGAKFAFIIKDISRDEFIAFDYRIRKSLSHYFEVDGKKITLRITSGGIFSDGEESDSSTVRGNVTYAAKQSKNSSQGDLIIFNDLVKTKHNMNLELIRVIHESVRNQCDGFYVLYQPIVSAKDNHICGAEALVRWNKAPFGKVPPGMFIEWLENDPAMYDLGAFVLRQALLDGNRFLQSNPDFILNVNISIRQLERHDFRSHVIQTLHETGFPPNHLCFELTERCKDMDISFLQQETLFFQSLGIRIAIDDYGTGSASTNIVIQVPIDEIKIDMSFVKDIVNNSKKKAMVKGIVSFANINGMDSCIEGIEDEEIQDFLKPFHATWFQGYHYSKPINADDFLTYMESD